MTDYRRISIDLIDPNPGQPRKKFSGLEVLAGSIKEKGLLEPIMVKPIGDRFMIVLGERRWRAAKLAGLTEIDAQVKDVSGAEAYGLALVENIQRQDLNPLEEAAAFEELQRQGMTQEQIAKTIGKGQSYVAHKLRLLRLPEFLTFYLQEGALTENHIRQVIKIKDIYPPGLMRPFSPEINGEAINDADTASFFLTYLRPEGRLVFAKAEPMQAEACNLFADYVSKHNAVIPQWEVAAFWWVSMAALLPLNVAELTTAINSWRERYEDAVIMWRLHYKRGGEPRDPELRKEYWGFWEDLRHSGSLSIEYETSAAAKWWVNNLYKVITQAGYCLPSNMQGGR